MCVIASKSTNASFPSKETLEICWNNNPDGAGFMFTAKDKVHIRKGFMTFEEFYKALTEVRTKYGDKIPCVMHFRIGTQGGNIPANTHPFPLSKNMDDLRKLSSRCDIGVAHNGIIELTTNYGKGVNYSDTMKFITDYLTLIIKKDIHWYKDKDTCKLIEKLIESRLCVLDKEKHIQLLGTGWNKDDKTGVYYSNESWKAKKVKYPAWNSAWEDDYYFPSSSTKGVKHDKWGLPDWEMYYDDNSGQYEFDDSCCPGTFDGDDAYCPFCKNCGKCDTYNEYLHDWVEETKDKKDSKK